MGLDFIRKKDERYCQARDSDKAMLDTEDLWDRANPDRVRELFTVQLRNREAVVEPGFRLLIIFRSETDAQVAQNGVVIGELPKDEARRLAARVKAGKTSGMLEVLIKDQPDMAGCFRVEATKPREISGE
jgi:hypothetical protein